MGSCPCARRIADKAGHDMTLGHARLLHGSKTHTVTTLPGFASKMSFVLWPQDSLCVRGTHFVCAGISLWPQDSLYGRAVSLEDC